MSTRKINLNWESDYSKKSNWRTAPAKQDWSISYTVAEPAQYKEGDQIWLRKNVGNKDIRGLTFTVENQINYHTPEFSLAIRDNVENRMWVVEKDAIGGLCNVPNEREQAWLIKNKKLVAQGWKLIEEMNQSLKG